MSWRWQKDWRPAGWRVMATFGQSVGLGFGTGYGWIALRCNGFWITVGPFTIDVIPPPPKWLQMEADEKIEPAQSA